MPLISQKTFSWFDCDEESYISTFSSIRVYYGDATYYGFLIENTGVKIDAMMEVVKKYGEPAEVFGTYSKMKRTLLNLYNVFLNLGIEAAARTYTMTPMRILLSISIHTRMY